MTARGRSGKIAGRTSKFLRLPDAPASAATDWADEVRTLQSCGLLAVEPDADVLARVAAATDDPAGLLDALAATAALRREVRERLAVVVGYGLTVMTLAVIVGTAILWTRVESFVPIVDDTARLSASGSRPTFTGGLAAVAGAGLVAAVSSVFAVAAVGFARRRRGLPLRWVGPVRRLDDLLGWADASAVLAGRLRSGATFEAAAEDAGVVGGRAVETVLSQASTAAETGVAPDEALSRVGDVPLAGVLGLLPSARRPGGGKGESLASAVAEGAAALRETAEVRAGRLSTAAWAAVVGVLAVGLLGYAITLFGPLFAAYEWLSRTTI